MSKRVGATDNTLPSMTRQADAAECDINNIMKRYEKTGVLPPFTEGFFGDVSELGDFQRVTNMVKQAEEIFMQFPAQFRASFENDVGAFVNWATDPANATAVQAAVDGAAKAPSTLPADSPAGEAPVAP